MKQPKGHSAGWKKSGAYTKSDCMSGSKDMSTKHMPMTQGKMPTYRELNTGNPSHDMINPEGRIGAGVRGFSHGIPGEAGKK